MKNLINLIIYSTLLLAIGLSSCSTYVPSESAGFDDGNYKTYKIKASEGDETAFVIEYQ